MAETFTLAEFATFATGMIVEVDHATRHALAKGAEIIADEAKRVLGTHDYGWPPLAPSTIARKATGDSPLLETGEMRDSIEWNAEIRSSWGPITGGDAYIGSNLERAVYHEMGTATIPPRPFLSGAAAHKEREVAELIGRHIVETVFKGHVV